MAALFRNSSSGALTLEQARALEIKRHNERKRLMREARELAEQGRGGDTEIAHVTVGEIVLPDALQTPAVLSAIRVAAMDANIPLDRLRVGSGHNSVNPNTGVPEFWFDEWRNKITNAFSGEDAQAATEGVAARAAYTGIKSDVTRGRYDDQVSGLDRFANDARARLKAESRRHTPPEVKVFIQDRSLSARDGSIGRANATSPVATEAARTLGRIGRGAGVLGAGLAAADIATSDNPYRAAVANAGSLLGGIGGGALGAVIGAPSVVGAPIGALGGSIVGGDVGYRAGEKIYDYGANQFQRWRR